MKSLNGSTIPFNVFCNKSTAFLNGKHFIKVIIPPFNPSIGNHIPLNTDCPVIIIEDIPPIDFSLLIQPNNIPVPIKNIDVTSDNKIHKIMLTLNIDESIITPTKKKKS